MVWKYIYHIPLPYMDGTGLAGSIVSLTFDLSCICLPNQTLVIQVLIKFFSIQSYDVSSIIWTTSVNF